MNNELCALQNGVDADVAEKRTGLPLLRQSRMCA